MKNLKLILLFLLPSLLDAQKNIPLIKNNGDVFFETIVIADSLTSEEIHQRSINWIDSRLKNAQFIVVPDTPGRIVRRFPFAYAFSFDPMLYEHELTIEVKEGKARYRVFLKDLGWLFIKNQNEWRTSNLAAQNIVEGAINKLYRSYISELKTNASAW